MVVSLKVCYKDIGNYRIRGAAKHKVLASHPTALCSILGISKNLSLDVAEIY